MAEFVYILSFITSAACTALLARAYMRSRLRLLFWSTLAFAGLATSNLLVWIDLRLLPDYDLSIWRTVPALVALAILCYGLIWESA
jgi:hypothetical protein